MMNIQKVLQELLERVEKLEAKAGLKKPGKKPKK